MNFWKPVLKAAGIEANKLGSIAMHARSFGGGFLKSAAIGAGVGGITGLIKGDNYDSTAALSNFTSGAIGGGAIGLGARVLFSRRGISGVGHLLKQTGSLGMSAARIGAPIANVGLKSAAFLGRNPGVAFAGAAVVGGAMYMAGPSNRDSVSSGDFDDAQSTSAFRNSTAGLTQGLHRGRHRS